MTFMSTVNVHEAKSNLSKLIAAVENGDENEIIIARNGRPAAKLVAIDKVRRKPVRIGLAKGKYRLPDDFDRDNDLIKALFEGRVPE